MVLAPSDPDITIDLAAGAPNSSLGSVTTPRQLVGRRLKVEAFRKRMAPGSRPTSEPRGGPFGAPKPGLLVGFGPQTSSQGWPYLTETPLLEAPGHSWGGVLPGTRRIQSKVFRRILDAECARLVHM